MQSTWLDSFSVRAHTNHTALASAAAFLQGKRDGLVDLINVLGLGGELEQSEGLHFLSGGIYGWHSPRRDGCCAENTGHCVVGITKRK